MSKWADDLVEGPVTVEEATEMLSRFNASHWHNRGGGVERARYSIPANPRRDDDIRLGAFIERVAVLIAVTEALGHELETRLVPCEHDINVCRCNEAELVRKAHAALSKLKARA